MSLILRPSAKTSALGQLSFVAALALADAARAFLPPQANVVLKWPNDLLVNGKKAAGILLETQSAAGKNAQAVIVGIGVNIHAAPEGAISFREAGVETTPAVFLDRLYKTLMDLYGLWLDKGFSPIRREWLAHAGNLGGMINVRLPKESFQAKFTGISDDGSLQVEMPDGARRDIASGEVFAL